MVDLVERLGGTVRRAKLINDVVAMGLGVPAVADDDLVYLHVPSSGGGSGDSGSGSSRGRGSGGGIDGTSPVLKSVRSSMALGKELCKETSPHHEKTTWELKRCASVGWLSKTSSQLHGSSSEAAGGGEGKETAAGTTTAGKETTSTDAARPSTAGQPTAPPPSSGVIAAVAAGTGLGAVFLTRNASGMYEAHPSEGGMTDFQATTEEQWAL